MTGVLSRAVRFLTGALLLTALVWILCALSPVGPKPPGMGAFFTKPTPAISELRSELPSDYRTTMPLSIAAIKNACQPSYLLRPWERPADHVRLQVTNRTLTIERNVSCSNYAFRGRWLASP